MFRKMLGKYAGGQLGSHKLENIGVPISLLFECLEFSKDLNFLN